MTPSLKRFFFRKIIIEGIFFLGLLVALSISIKYLVDKFDLEKFNLTTPLMTIYKEDILLISAMIGGLFISFFFKKVGKSVKSLNDCALFFSAAIVLYKTYDQNPNDILTLIENAIDMHTLALFKAMILLCSFAKFFISILEFYFEKLAEFNKKHNTKDELISNLSNAISLLRSIKNSKDRQSPF
ncbi:hypothetical protein PXW75_25210 [Klebsiella pneumoniae]|uniref:hypothetical protein n=1 Tax=Klebsiella TaxID=570 RepID=UPI0023812074|nr:hypothetical protein [Klebsiella pneumoniae]MDE4847732.1 hypothetical protein [Klebsiella pneumoniae]HBQ5785141.1 hypothetical protein [Klebsiella pneumoniae subsp. pneumoniae]